MSKKTNIYSLSQINKNVLDKGYILVCSLDRDLKMNLEKFKLVNYSATSYRASCFNHRCLANTKNSIAKSYTMSTGVNSGNSCPIACIVHLYLVYFTCQRSKVSHKNFLGTTPYIQLSMFEYMGSMTHNLSNCNSSCLWIYSNAYRAFISDTSN